MATLTDKSPIQDTSPEEDPNNPVNRQAAAQKSLSDREARGSSDGTPGASTGDGGDIRGLESEGSNQPWKFDASSFKANPISKKGLNKYKALLKKSGPSGLVGGGILGILGLLGFFASAAGPIAAVENMVTDLDDKVAAYQMRGNAMNKLRVRAAKEGSIKGCAKLSLRCKFKTLSSKEVARLKRAGIEVSGKKFAGRTLAQEYKFRNQTYDAEKWNEALKGRGGEYKAQLRANNMKFISFADRPFLTKVLGRFGLTKKPPGLKGSLEDRINQLLTAGKAASPEDLRFRPAVDEKGNPIKGKYDLVGPDGKKVGTYTEAEKARLEKDFAKIKGAKPMSPKMGSLLGAASIVGYWDLACTINNMLGAATVAQKINANRDLVQYAWGIVSTIHKIKAGDATAEDSETVGKLLNDTDTRQKVIDAVATAKASEKAGANGSSPDVMMDNPNYGKSALDSELIKMSMNGGVAPVTNSQKQFALGFGMTTLLWGLSSVSSIVDVVTNIGSGNACAVVQNWFVRGAGIAVAVIAGIGSFGSTAAAQATAIAAMVAAMFIISSIISHSISGSPLDNLKDKNATVERGDAAWTGFASMQSINAQAVGMKPGTAAEISNYRTVANSVNDDYLAMEAEGASPFDITNEGTFMGSIVNSYRKTIGSSVSLANILRAPAALTSSLLSPVAGAATLDSKRFKRCDDKDLKSIGVDADVQCNVRYVMPEKDLALDTDTVATWMETHSCGGTGTCVPKDTEDGLPKGYTPPDSRSEQNGLVEFARGATVGQFVTENDIPNDYAAFLEYCAYRVAPYGKTFEEVGLLGSADKDWMSGKRCAENSKELSYFRVYTLDRSLLTGLDEDTADDSSANTALPTPAATAASTGCDGPATMAQAIKTGWGGYSNGKIPDSALKELSFAPGEKLNSNAACGAETLNSAFKKQFGSNISVTDSYRSYDEQVATKAKRGDFAATPGTSNHGWGLALDLGSGISSYDSKQYKWMMINAPKYGWVNPPWAQRGGSSTPEPWHWEYAKEV